MVVSSLEEELQCAGEVAPSLLPKYLPVAVWELTPGIGMVRSAYVQIRNHRLQEKIKRNPPVMLALGMYHGFALLSLYYFMR